MNIILIAPVSLWGTQLQTASGNYVIGTDGLVTVDSSEVEALLGAGFVLTGGGAGGNGLRPTNLPLLSAFCSNGAPLAAAAAAGNFGVTCTPGTVLELISEAANNNTKTDKALWEFVLPQGYVAGQNITVTVNSQINGAGTPGTKTIDMSAWRCATDGTGTTDLVSTNAQNLGLNATDFAFVIDGTTLSPGDKLLVQVTTALQETAATAITCVISSARVS